MRQPIDNGGSAFPVAGGQTIRLRDGSSHTRPQPGMSLRDWFAGHADPDWVAMYCKSWCGCAAEIEMPKRIEAAWAYADAMLKARGESK